MHSPRPLRRSMAMRGRMAATSPTRDFDAQRKFFSLTEQIFFGGVNAVRRACNATFRIAIALARRAPDSADDEERYRARYVVKWRKAKESAAFG
jgi:hypothetical protein